MKVSKYFYLLAVSCTLLIIAGCDEDEGPLGPGEVTGQPQDRDPVEDFDFLEDNNKAPMKNSDKVIAIAQQVDNDVLVYDYGEMILLGIQELIIPDISKETIDGSVFLAFYNPSDEEETAWHQMPGLSSSGLFNIKTYLYQSGTDYSFIIKTIFPSGVSFKEAVALRGVKIFITPKENNNPSDETSDKPIFDLIS